MRLHLDEDGSAGDVLAVPLGEGLKKLKMHCDACGVDAVAAGGIKGSVLGGNLQPGARGRNVHSALGAVGWGSGVCVLAGVEPELGQLVTCKTRSDAAPRCR